MNKNKWFLNGGRSFRLLCETYENKIADLQHKVDTLQGFLDHDIEYDMDKTIQEQKIKIADLEKKNKVLTQNLEDTEIINAGLKKKLKEELKTIADKDLSFVARFDALEKENAELKEYNKYLKRQRQGGIQKQYNKVAIIKQQDDQLTKAKELLERLLITSCNSDVLNLLPNCSEVLRVRVEAEQFLSEVEK